MRRTQTVPMMMAAASALLVTAGMARAQDAGMTRDIIARAVKSIADRVESSYVVPDTGRMIADLVRKRHADGAYDRLTRAQFTDRVTADLRALNGDAHLNIRSVAGSAPAGAPAGPRMVMRTPGGGGPGISPDALTQARRENFNVRRAERLTGNIGYMDLSLVSTSGSEEAFQVIDAAMSFLERTDAMIIDLRSAPGGDPRMSDYVASYFFGPDSIRTLTTSVRGGAPVERWTRNVAGKRRPTVPVYVLTGPGTGSAAEDLAFIFRSTGRATLVGERSAGAGRPNGLYPADEGFMVSVSIGRTVDPRTGKEWERVGIEPEISAPLDEALVRAQSEALKALAGASQDVARRRSLDFARENIEARSHRRTVSAELLAQFAGDYDTRRIVLDGGKLYSTRIGGRSREELISISDTSFALGEATHVEFVRDGGRVAAVRFLTPDGQVGVLPRTP